MPKASPLRFKSGETILTPGQSVGKRVYRVLNGLVRIQCQKDGEVLTLRQVFPGGVFGEEALADGARHYWAVAALDTSIEHIDVFQLSADTASEIAAALVSALAETYTAVERISSRRLKNRLAAVLLELASSPLAYHDRRGKPVLRVTHDELAALVGSVRETTTKAIGELAHEGALEAGYGRVRLLDEQKLQELARSRA